MTEPNKTAGKAQAHDLKATTFLGVLPDDAFDALLKRAHISNFPRQAELCRQGEPGDSLMLIVSGRVKVFSVTSDGREIVHNFLASGDVVGEIAVLDGRLRTATVVALEPVETLMIYRRDLMPLLSAHPGAMVEVIEVLCEKLRLATSMLEDSTHDMARRTAKGLLRIADRHGRVTKNGIVIDLSINQRDLGNFLRLSRENTSRQLGALRSRGLVHLDGPTLTIVDRTALATLADEGE